MKVSVRLWANCFSFLGLWFFTYEMRELRWMHPRVQPKSERGTVLGQMCLTGRGQEFGFYVTAATPCDPLLRPSLYVCWKFSITGVLPPKLCSWWTVLKFPLIQPMVTVTDSHPVLQFAQSSHPHLMELLGQPSEKSWIPFYRWEIQALKKGRDLPKVIGQISKEPSANLGLIELRLWCVQHPTCHGCSAIFIWSGKWWHLN